MKLYKTPVKVHRESLSFDPDHTKVIFRFFEPSPTQKQNAINRILNLGDKEVHHILDATIQNFTDRHDNVERLFKNNFDKLKLKDDLSLERRLLIGAYFTMEYAIETAALLNPSVVPHPDQNGTQTGQLKVILSFRAVGEGHMSSIVFREGVIEKNGSLRISENDYMLERGHLNEEFLYHKKDFETKLKEIHCYQSVRSLLDNLLEKFSLAELKDSTQRFVQKYKDQPDFNQEAINTLIWLGKSNFEMDFDEERHLSGRVIFPRSKGEVRALEDARFVQFVDPEGEIRYYATYTAYDGRNVLPQLIETRNFRRFKILTMMGSGSQNKGMALFPEKINNQYVMISRNDNENLYLMRSERVTHWRDPELLRVPTFFWEFFQIGNNGSPLKTKEGWLVLTHGVGPVRTYCIGAILLDLHDPSKVLKATRDPLLFPLENERDGYVPNVVYSCGSVIHAGNLIIPYAISDTRSGVAWCKLAELLDSMEEV